MLVSLLAEMQVAVVAVADTTAAAEAVGLKMASVLAVATTAKAPVVVAATSDVAHAQPTRASPGQIQDTATMVAVAVAVAVAAASAEISRAASVARKLHARRGTIRTRASHAHRAMKSSARTHAAPA